MTGLLARRRLAVVGTAIVLSAGCASTQVDSQWADPQTAVGSLRMARVLVLCESYEVVLRLACEERMAAELTARGVTAVVAGNAAAGAERTDPNTLRQQAARDAGATVILVTGIGIAEPRSGPAFSVGLGGFGWGSRGGVGVGVSVPVGPSASRHAANSTLTDAASGRVIWSARATAAASGDLQAQMGELAKAIGEAADKAGLF